MCGTDISPLVPARAPIDNRLMSLALRLVRPMVDLMLPPRCGGCGAIVDDDHRFCADCWRAIDFLDDGGCARCSKPLDGRDGLVCGTCLAAPPDFDAVIAGVAYGPVARRVTLRLKRGRRPGLARTMARVLAPRLADRDAVLVPVPLHRWRLWSRGFNQSVAIARALERRTGHAVRVDLLDRIRPTQMLRGLNPTARRKAVRGAFAVRGRVDDAHVYLVDDVLTTGATANACARALKKAGAKRVTLVCWARVLGDD